MRHKHNNGFVLLMVVAMIPLIGMIAAVMTVNSRHLLIQTRLEELNLLAKTACDSGIAWAKCHPDEIRTLSSEHPITLMIDHPQKNTDCVIDCVKRDTAGIQVRITGRAGDKRFEQEFHKELFIALPVLRN
jgi:hypothetical protein